MPGFIMPFTTAEEKERDRIISEVLSEISSVEKKVEFGKRIVVTGKGGVGKTVISAVLAHLFAESGLKFWLLMRTRR
jgi:Mrp family chromosome partitioning ATPase